MKKKKSRFFPTLVVREISGEFTIFHQSVLLHTELAIQSAFWNGRHPLSFHQTCGFQKYRSELRMFGKREIWYGAAVIRFDTRVRSPCQI